MDLKASIEILRPINCIMGSLTVVIGILNTRTSISSEILLLNLILGILTYFFLAGSGMVINDIYDIEIDKINRPNRPIPSGRVSLYQAKQIFVITLLIGIFISVINNVIPPVNLFNIGIALLFGLTGIIYAKWGKKSGFMGNIIVSISFSIGLVYGAFLNTQQIPAYIVYFFLTSFFLLLSREVIKGCEDIKGDKEEGVKTLAITIGIKKASIFALICQISAMVFFILPLFTQIINPFLFLITMIPGLIVVGYSIILNLTEFKSGTLEFGKISLILKLGALSGLIAFVFASV